MYSTFSSSQVGSAVVYTGVEPVGPMLAVPVQLVPAGNEAAANWLPMSEVNADCAAAAVLASVPVTVNSMATLDVCNDLWFCSVTSSSLRREALQLVCIAVAPVNAVETAASTADLVPSVKAVFEQMVASDV